MALRMHVQAYLKTLSIGEVAYANPPSRNTKPRSLFAKTSAKKLSAKTNNGELFGQDITPSKTQSTPSADIEMSD
jgi:hypothetical protein